MIVRSGVRRLLDRQSDIEVVGEAATADETLRSVREREPNVVVMDLGMPGGGTIDAIRSMSNRTPPVRVVVFTASDEEPDVVLSLRAGASAYVLKRSAETELIVAIRSVAAGREHLDSALDIDVAEHLTDRRSEEPAASPKLSHREAQVLQLIGVGYTNREVADRLGIGVKSAETYRHRITQKLGLRSRAELTRYLLRAGLLDPERVDRRRS